MRNLSSLNVKIESPLSVSSIHVKQSVEIGERKVNQVFSEAKAKFLLRSPQVTDPQKEIQLFYKN